MKYLILLFGFLICFACKEEASTNNSSESKNETVQETNANIPTLDYSQLKPWLNKKDDKTYVVNFWATWCAPCIKELPYFENIQKNYSHKNVEVILVSLDFPKTKPSNLIPFVKKHDIQSKVLHLDDPNEQFWIADISQDWTGAIPATLIYNNETRKFYEQSFTQEEIENEVKSFIN